MKNEISPPGRLRALPLLVVAAALAACAPMDRSRMAELMAPEEGVGRMDNTSGVLKRRLADDRQERVTLLPQSDGRPSAVTVTSPGGKETVLAQPFTQASVDDGGGVKTATIGNTSVNNRYVDALTALPVSNFSELVRRTVLSNPEVQARWHGMKLSRYQRNEALAQFLPSLDFFASARREWITRPGGISFRQNGRNTSLTLSHNLYNGFADINNTRQADHNLRGRYFDLLDISEEAAYEATRAHLDVDRYTQLVALAQDNLTVHGEIRDLIEERTRSGVDRRVDLELAIGRYALAQSNLATEEANLHDVSARYVRINGVRPTTLQGGLPDDLKDRVPSSLADGLRQVLAQSPAVKAAVENLRANEMAALAHNAAFQPRVDLKASVGSANDFSAVQGNTKDSRLAVELNWNLYRGQSDVARRTQLSENVSQARYLHASVCRETQYAFEQAYTEYQKLVEQQAYLEEYRTTTDRALQAYRQQFSIGQRTLLDVLDSQNEYFEAQRAYIDAEYRTQQVLARLQQVAGRLLPALGLLPLSDQEPASALPDENTEPLDCQATPSQPLQIDKEAVLQKAMQERPVRR